MASRETDLKDCFGEEGLQALHDSKVLVVGAGGIGCELLKTLVISGFMDITVIDLDTIDMSNLNRQFLFRTDHVGQSKSEVAATAALKYNPNVSIDARRGNIKDPEYGTDFFRSFSVVLNALDNIADIPLIESGTEGYLGQTTVIRKGVSQCYECRPQETPKSFAVCTIRSNPSVHKHCTVWAKMLFGRCFGIENDENAVTQMASNECTSPEAVFARVYGDDIDHLANMKDLWKHKTPPKPLNLEEVLAQEDAPTTSHDSSQLSDQKVWSVSQNGQTFLASTKRLLKRREEAPLEFDKDDDDALDFVTSAANLRAHIFGIQMESRFKVKEDAGNIMPAIATTNAIISGFAVAEAIKLLTQRHESSRSMWLKRFPFGGRQIESLTLEGPDPSCYVCGRNVIIAKVDAKNLKLDWFVEKILKQELKMISPTIMEGGRVLYEADLDDSDEEEMTRNANQLGKKFTDLNLFHNSLLDITDTSQQLNVNIVIEHSDNLDEDKPFEIERAANGTKSAENEVEDAGAADARKRSGDFSEDQSAKRTKADVL